MHFLNGEKANDITANRCTLVTTASCSPLAPGSPLKGKDKPNTHEELSLPIYSNEDALLVYERHWNPWIKQFPKTFFYVTNLDCERIGDALIDLDPMPLETNASPNCRRHNFTHGHTFNACNWDVCSSFNLTHIRQICRQMTEFGTSSIEPYTAAHFVTRDPAGLISMRVGGTNTEIERIWDVKPMCNGLPFTNGNLDREKHSSNGKTWLQEHLDKLGPYQYEVCGMEGKTCEIETTLEESVFRL